jgi:hypothetical protein
MNGCIINSTPSGEFVSVKAGGTVKFSVKTSSSSDSFIWYVDNVVQTGYTANEFIYAPIISEIGTHEVKVNVSGKQERKWSVQVKIATFKSYFGGSATEYLVGVIKTADGGHLLAGTSYSSDIPGLINAGEIDIYIVKLNSTGEIEWQKMFGSELHDRLQDVKETIDGGYIVSFTSYKEYYQGSSVIKIDGTGEIEWRHDYIENEDMHIVGYILQASDGSFYLKGISYINYDEKLLLIKFSESGSVVWKKTFDDIGFVYLEEAPDGDIILVGDDDIIKVDSNGDLKWKNHYDNSQEGYLILFQFAHDGGYILAFANSASHRLSIIKLDEAGTLEWQQKFEKLTCSVYNYNYKWLELLQAPDNKYILAYSSFQITSDRRDYTVAEIAQNGSINWLRTFGGSYDDSVDSIIRTSDGGYILTGTSNSVDIPGVTGSGLYDIYAVKIDSQGNLQWQNMYGGIYDDDSSSVIQGQDGDYVIRGKFENANYENDSELMRIDPSGNLIWRKVLGKITGLYEEYYNSLYLEVTPYYEIILAGTRKEYKFLGNNDSSYFIMKLDAEGNL